MFQASGTPSGMLQAPVIHAGVHDGPAAVLGPGSRKAGHRGARCLGIFVLRAWPQAAKPAAQKLHLHHDRQDHWAAMRLLIEELAQRMLDLIFDERPVRGMAIQTNE